MNRFRVGDEVRVICSSSRWRGLEPELPDVSRARLIRFLFEYFGFSQARATIETDDLFSLFEKRLQCASEAEGIEQLKAS